MDKFVLRLLFVLLLTVNPAIAAGPVTVSRGCPAHAENWGLNKGDYSIKICRAKARLVNPQPVKVAVVDTIVDDGHAFFKGSVESISIQKSHHLPADFVVPAETNATFVDHGTHISGIIHMVTTSALGDADKVQIMSLQGFINSKAVDPLEDSIKAFRYAIANGANVINYSGGGTTFSPKERAVIEEAGAKGILVVVAAGNDGKEFGDGYSYYPAGYRLPNMISVASLNPDGKLLNSSNYGALIDVSAPGESIISTFPENRFGAMSGTSQATAFVTGVAALILSQNPKLRPDEVKKIVVGTATLDDKLESTKSKKTIVRDQASEKRMPEKVLKVRPPVVNADAAIAFVRVYQSNPSKVSASRAKIRVSAPKRKSKAQR